MLKIAAVSRALAVALCLTQLVAIPLEAQEPDGEFSFEGCLGEAATAEQRKACYEPVVVAMMQQDPRGLPAAMQAPSEELGVMLNVCLTATLLISGDDSGACWDAVEEIQTRIQSQALEALPPAVQEQLAALQASYDACLDEVFAEHDDLPAEKADACREQRRIGALQAVTTASETWECYDRFARERAAPLVVLDGVVKDGQCRSVCRPGYSATARTGRTRSAVWDRRSRSTLGLWRRRHRL